MLPLIQRVLALEEKERQPDRKWDSRGAVTHNRSSHQDEFSTVHTLREGARQLPVAHVAMSKKQSAYPANLKLSGY